MTTPGSQLTDGATPAKSPVPEGYDDEINLVELLHKLQAFGGEVRRERALILRLTVSSLAAGLFLAFGSGTEYTASTRILPYRSAGASGSLSGLAGIAGIRLPSGGDLTITADLYPEVAKSRDFRISVAETPLRFSSLNRSVSTIEYFRDLYPTPPFSIVASYTIGLPGKLMATIRSVSQGKGVLTESRNSEDALASYDPQYLGLVNMLAGRTAITTERSTAVITISGTMPDPYAAADLVRITSNRLMERIINYESRKADEQFRFVQEQHQQAKARYERAQRDLASFTDRNRALMTAISQIDRERLQREYELTFEVYQQVSRELEQARIKMNQDRPVFTVLEQVTVPTERSSPRRGRIVLLSLLVGLLAGVGLIAFRQMMVRVQAQMLLTATPKAAQ